MSLPIRYRFSGVVTGPLTALQLSASPTRSQKVDSLVQVLLLDEFMLLTCKHRSTQMVQLFSRYIESIQVGLHCLCAKILKSAIFLRH